MHTMAMTALLNGRNGSLAAADRTRSPSRLHLAARSARSHSLFQQRSNGALSGHLTLRQQHRQSGTSLAARRAEYDDDEDWDDGPGLGIVPRILGGALGAVGSITDFVARNTPASVSRGVVDISVKAGLALVVLGFARSLLGLVTTIGTIVFGLWLASKVLGGGDDGKSGSF